MAKGKKKKDGRRNAAPAGAAPRRRSLKRAALPGWKDTVAAVIGGGGSAFLSGLAVNQKIIRPATGAAVLMAAGGAAALLTDGTSRVVGNSMASAGAGQLALALMQRSAVAKQAEEKQAAQASGAVPPVPPAALPAPPAPMPAQPAVEPRGANFGGGYVTALFRDAANELAELEDEERRMGVRDSDLGGADVFDLDDVAA